METSGTTSQVSQAKVGSAFPGESLTAGTNANAAPSGAATAAEETTEQQSLVTQLGNLLALPTAQALAYQSVPIDAPNPADSGLSSQANEDGSIPLLDYYFPLIQDALDSVLDTLETGNMGMTAGLNHYRLQPDISRPHSHPRHYSSQAKKPAGRELRDRQTAQTDAQSFSATMKSMNELTEAMTRALDSHAGTPSATQTEPFAQEQTSLQQDEAASGTEQSDATALEKLASYLKSFQAISNTLDVMHVMMTMNGILKASQRRRGWSV